jgi:hypothetical protein
LCIDYKRAAVRFLDAAEYQKLGFVMDIGSKIKRHEAMEAQLAELERDIRTLEAGDVVLVVPDNGSGY